MGSPKTPLCLDWIIWQVASSRLSQEEDYGVSEYMSFIPLHCAARLRACAVSNIETSRQKTFVRLNKVEAKNLIENGECMARHVKNIKYSPTQAAVVAVADVGVVEAVMMRMTQRCCENRLD